MDKFGFNKMRTQADARDMAQMLIKSISNKEQFLKVKAEEIVGQMYKDLESKNTSPIAKTMILHVLKEITYQCHIKLLSFLMSHKINGYLFQQAMKIDPKKSPGDKGSNLFPGQPKIGNEYMRLLCELLQIWGDRFGKAGKRDQPTKYRKNLNQLREKGVVLPTNYAIIDVSRLKQKIKSSTSPLNMNQSTSPTPGGPVGSAGGSGGPTGPGGKKLYHSLKFLYQKIDIYVNSFEDEQNLQTLIANIQKNHQNIKKQWNQLSKRGQQAQQDDQSMNLYFALMEFTEQQNKSYLQYMPVQDASSYKTQVKMVFQKQFQHIKIDGNSGQPQQNRPLLGNANPPKQFQASRPSSTSQSGIDVMGLINNFYNKVQQRSKSPGFKGIQKQIQGKRQPVRKSPARISSRSPRNRSQVGLNRSNASSVSESKIPPIFTDPPNPYPGSKNYEGETINQNRQLARIYYNIKKQQGSRRFKVSNFRNKNSLFQNEHIQVGFKSQAVYQSINQFNHFILLNLFIGNRTNQGIKQCQVQYKGDNNQLLYANPKNVDSIIPAGYQNKHDLMITPIKVPFNFMVMHISYKFRDSGYMVSVVLPNSILKFATYMKTTKQQFDKNWKSSKKFKTNNFRLCRYLPPDNFNKWISLLQNNTKYSQFSAKGSETDLQLFCNVIMLQKYQAVLKINVRPNLHVVLQLGVLDDSPEAIEYFKFYLQTLELIMKQLND